MNTTITNDALAAAYARRAKARTTADAAAETLKRGERLSAVAAEKVGNLEKKLEKHESAQAQRLAAAISAGGPTLAVPDVAAGGLAAELAAAKSHASIHARALDSLKAASAQAQAELAAAQAEVVAAVDQVFDDQDIEIARQLSYHLSEALRIGQQLLFTAIANETRSRKMPPAGVAEALAKLDVPLLNRLHVATNVAKFGDQAAHAQRFARRTALIAGDSAQIETVAA
jgi:hypothetical protein